MNAEAKVRDELIPIEGEDDIVRARQHARELAKTLRFSLIDQSRIATAVSELARNVIYHATGGRGEVVIRQVDTNGKGTGVEVVVSDGGPGIADIRQAMQRGYSSGDGMGLGLPGTKRLMDEMEVQSAPDAGTRITIRKWRR
jgi:serine/threonine-protein kinase RsbT